MKHRLLATAETLEKHRHKTAVFAHGVVAFSVWLIVIGIWSLVDAIVFRTHHFGIRCTATVLSAILFFGITIELSLHIRRRRSAKSIAESIESLDLKTSHQLISAIDFIEHSNRGESLSLRHTVIARANRHLRYLPKNSLVSRKNRVTIYVTAILTTTLLITGTLLFPGYVKIAAKRILFPWQEIPWPKRTQLALQQPISVILRGQSWQITIVDTLGRKLPSDLQTACDYIEPNFESKTKRIPINYETKYLSDRKQLVLTIQRPFSSFELQVSGGDDVLPPYYVTVEEPATITDMTIRAQPPKYTQVTDFQWRPGTLIPAGSNITLTTHLNRPVRDAKLHIDDHIIHSDSNNNDTDFEYNFTIENTKTSPEIVCFFDYETPTKAIGTTVPFRLAIKKDYPPQILAIESEEYMDELQLPEDATLTLIATVKDDYHVKEMSIQWINNANEKITNNTIEMEKIKEENKISQWRGKIQFSSEDFSEIDTIRWYLEATDDTSQQTKTAERLFTIIPKDHYEQILEKLAVAAASDIDRVSDELTIESNRSFHLEKLIKTDDSFSSIPASVLTERAKFSVQKIPQTNLAHFLKILELIHTSSTPFDSWLEIWYQSKQKNDFLVKNLTRTSEQLKPINQQQISQEIDFTQNLQTLLNQRATTSQELAAIYHDLSISLLRMVRRERIRMELEVLRKSYRSNYDESDTVFIQKQPKIYEQFTAFVGDLSEEIESKRSTPPINSDPSTPEERVLSAINQYQITSLIRSITNSPDNNLFRFQNDVKICDLRLEQLQWLLSGESKATIRKRRLERTCKILERLSNNIAVTHSNSSDLEIQLFLDDEQISMPATVAILRALFLENTHTNNSKFQEISTLLLSIWNITPPQTAESTLFYDAIFTDSTKRFPPDYLSLLLLQNIANQSLLNAAKTGDFSHKNFASTTQNYVANVLRQKFLSCFIDMNSRPELQEAPNFSSQFTSLQRNTNLTTQNPENFRFTSENALVMNNLLTRMEQHAIQIDINPSDENLPNQATMLTEDLCQFLATTLQISPDNQPIEYIDNYDIHNTTESSSENINKHKESSSEISFPNSLVNETDFSHQSLNPMKQPAHQESKLPNPKKNNDLRTDGQEHSVTSTGTVSSESSDNSSQPSNPRIPSEESTPSQENSDLATIEKNASEASIEQIWGELPERIQQVSKMCHSSESFHPLYQRETESFFRRLLEYDNSNIYHKQ